MRSVDGADLITRPEWTDVFVGGSHRVSVGVIDRRIVVSRPTGYGTLESLITALKLIHQVVDETIPSGRSFIWIADYSQLEGSSREARKHFAEATREWKQLHTLIFCGLSSLLTVAAKLATKLRLVNYDVLFADSYEEAVELAGVVAASLSETEALPPQSIDERTWQQQLEGLSITIELLGENVLHAVVAGHLEVHHVDQIEDFKEEVARATGIGERPYFIVVGLDGLEGVTYGARQRYTNFIRRWHERYPFDAEVFYGANSILRAAFFLSRPFAPFEAHLADTFEEAMAFVEDRLLEMETPSSGDEVGKAARQRNGQAEIDRYVDELLQVLSEVSWDAEEERDVSRFDPGSPFSPVFEAIELLKSEFGELSREQSLTQERHRMLQNKLARARKMEALGLLAGGVAHDLNNVLSGLVTYPEFLLMDDKLEPTTREALDTIRRSGEQAAAIVNDLVTVARGAAITTQPVTLDDVVSDYLNSLQFRRLCDHHPWVTVQSDLAGRGVKVAGSHVHLKKVVMNLVSNATEAIPESDEGGLVRVATAFRYLDRPIFGYDEIREGEYAVLTVMDDGPGIASSEIERIFEPFYTKKVMGRSGTGLGLTVVWNTVHDHGGHLDVSSSDDGTRFDLYFPVTRDPLEAAAEKTPVSEYRGNGERVLVVDDVEGQREIAVQMLASLGYTVDVAVGGEDAVKKVAEQPVDLVLIDMVMDPGINGRETYERISQIKPGQKAVITSGFSETEEVATAQALGAGPFISKPFTVEKIGLAIRDELRK